MFGYDNAIGKRSNQITFIDLVSWRVYYNRTLVLFLFTFQRGLRSRMSTNHIWLMQFDTELNKIFQWSGLIVDKKECWLLG